MYKCCVCAAEFDEPETTSYVEDMDGEQHYQTFYVPICPCCGSEEIDEYKEEADE